MTKRKKSKVGIRKGGGKKKAPESVLKNLGREMASSAIGVGTTFGAISGAGIGGFSAAGITSGLATLGIGSMLGGILVAPALGYGAYRASKWIFTPSQEMKTE